MPAASRTAIASPATLGIGTVFYNAAQFVTFDLPAYAEQAIVGGNLRGRIFNVTSGYGGKGVARYAGRCRLLALRAELRVAGEVRSWEAIGSHSPILKPAL
jgi:hypothetical protein